MGNNIQKHIISIRVANQAGVLARISILFSRRGYNIESLAVGPTEDETVSRITLVVKGDQAMADQLVAQVRKLIDVYEINNITNIPIVARELNLIRIECTLDTRLDIVKLIDIFRGKIVDITDNSIMVEITGGDDKIVAFEKLLKPYKILEMVRTGFVALPRGELK